MDAKEIRQKGAEELTKLAQTLRSEIRDLRVKANLRSLRTVRELRNKRKDLARVLTVTKQNSN